MPILYIMCGPSGCGKTTWAHNFINMYPQKDIHYVSRDEIRFSILKDGEDYFSREKEVFKKFVATLQQTLIDGFDIIADATHLNEFSRRKLTQAIDMQFTDYTIVYVVFNTTVTTCIMQNARRHGRARVSETIIRNMCRDFRAPTKDEDERVIDIIEVGE